MERMPENKFRELILYVCLRSEGDRWFGKTKLNKLLYFIDSEAFRQTGRTVSGQEYIKKPFGPVPEHVDEVLRALKDVQDLAIRPAVVGIYPQEQPLALRGPKLTNFTAEELLIVDTVIQQCRSMTASQCSKLSHQSAGWRVAEMGERIPIGTELISDRELTQDEMDHAAELARLPDVKAFVMTGER